MAQTPPPPPAGFRPIGNTPPPPPPGFKPVEAGPAGAGELGTPQPAAHAAPPSLLAGPSTESGTPKPTAAPHDPFAYNPGEGKPGGYYEPPVLRQAGNAGRSMVRNFEQMGDTLVHPSKWAINNPNPTNVFGGDEQSRLAQSYKEGGFDKALSDAGGDALTAAASGKAAETVGGLPGAAKQLVAGDVDKVPAGNTITPRGRYEAAKRLGVQLDAADATGSSLLGNVKRVGENSLLGGPLYDASKSAGTAGLTDATDRFLNTLYEGDREAGGKAIQDALKTNQGTLRSGAENGFNTLTDQTKGQPVKGAPAVGETAKSLLKEIEPLAEKYPTLAPGKTLGVLRDLSNVGGKEAPPAPVGFLDAPGSEFRAEMPAPKPPQPDTWSDLQRLRSATHDLTTNSPDLVKSQAIAPLQQMTSALDDAMTNASSGLTPAQEAIFRRANAEWKDMKATYDDPSSPFYQAVRTDNPSTLFQKVGPQTAENARNLRTRLSPVEQYPDESLSAPALGAVRRGTVESALRPNNEGAPQFKNFGTQWNRIPADYRNELFTLPQNQTLQDVMHTSNLLGKDFNPSGTFKQTQKYLEASALGAALLHPTAAIEPLLQYPAAKLMTSPKAVDWLMRPSAPKNPFFARGALAAAAMASRDQGR